MDRHRIGKDLTIRWPIKTNGQPASLAGRQLTLELYDCLGSRRQLPFTIECNAVVTKFFGTTQNRLGKYRLTLWENKGTQGQTAVDACDAFELVPYTFLEKHDTPSDLTVDTSELSGNIIVGVKGDKGDKGEPFRYEDFTPEQLTLLALTWDKLTPEQKAEIKGEKGDRGNPAEAIARFVILDSAEDLPLSPTPEEIITGYLIDGSLYVYVETGGNVADGIWQDCGPLRGETGTRGSAFFTLKAEPIRDKAGRYWCSSLDIETLIVDGQKAEVQRHDYIFHNDSIYAVEAISARDIQLRFIRNLKGDRGEKGAPFRFEDFTPEQIASIRKPAQDAADEAKVSAAESASRADIAREASLDAMEQAGNAKATVEELKTLINKMVTEGVSAAIEAQVLKNTSDIQQLQNDASTQKIYRCSPERWEEITASERTLSEFVSTHIGYDIYVLEDYIDVEENPDDPDTPTEPTTWTFGSSFPISFN